MAWYRGGGVSSFCLIFPLLPFAGRATKHVLVLVGWFVFSSLRVCKFWPMVTLILRTNIELVFLSVTKSKLYVWPSFYAQVNTLTHFFSFLPNPVWLSVGLYTEGSRV